MEFVSSLDLSRMLYEKQIAPILADRFPNLKYAAATLGMCSEILGLDDHVSMDHEWGPRIGVFLSEKDHARYAQDVMTLLRDTLPVKFEEFDMMWRKPGIDIHDTRATILYHVRTLTVSDALQFCGGLNALPLLDLDWLRISEQHLLEFTAGAVYRDDLGELTRARRLLAYYPDSVLRFLLMCEWNAVGGDWFPIGRIGSRSDQLGLRVQTASVVKHLMRIAFMVSKAYAPYKKWFGTLFKELPVAQALGPVLLELLCEDNWQRVEEMIGTAASILLQQQNELGLVPSVTLKATSVDDGRHHIKYEFWDIGQRLGDAIQPPLKSLAQNQVSWLHERSLILWNGEVGKWSLLLRKQNVSPR